MRRIAKSILILLMLAGLVRAAWFGNAIAKLSREKQELQRIVGDFDLAKLNVNDFNIVRRPTEDPFHFEWSIQHPTSQLLKGKLDCLGKSRLLESYVVGSFLGVSEKIERQSLYFEFDTDKVRIHLDGMISQLVTRKLSPAAVRVLEKNWSRFEIRVVGENGIESFPGDESRALVTVKIPDDVVAELKRSDAGTEFPILSDGVIFQFELVSRVEGAARPLL